MFRRVTSKGTGQAPAEVSVGPAADVALTVRFILESTSEYRPCFLSKIFRFLKNCSPFCLFVCKYTHAHWIVEYLVFIFLLVVGSIE